MKKGLSGFLALVAMAAEAGMFEDEENDEITLSEEDFAKLEVGDRLSIAKPSSNPMISRILGFNYQDIGYFVNKDTNQQLRINNQNIEDDCPYIHYNYTFLERVETTYKCGHCSNDHFHNILVYCEETQESFYATHSDFRLKDN